MSKHIILGDVHLGKSLGIGKPAVGSKLNSRVQDQLDLLYWVLKTAIELKIKSIIITGDVYEEPRPHPALIQYFMAWLKRCEKEEIEVDIIVGNHDIVKSGSYTISALDIIPAVELPFARTHKNITTVNYDGVSFTFVPYRDRRMYDAPNPNEAFKLLVKELEAHPGQCASGNVKVVVGHLAIDGSLYIGDEIDDMLNEIFVPANTFKDWDYVWMGHVHKPQVLSFEKPYVAHVGSMDRSNFDKGELDHDKRIILIDSEKPNLFEEIILPTRSLRKVEIDVPNGKDTTDFVINELFSLSKNNYFKDNILRLEIHLGGQETPNADRDKISRFLYDNLEVHHICNFLENRSIVVVSAEDKEVLFDNSMSVSSAVDTYTNNILKFESDDEKQMFSAFGNECIADLKDKKGKTA